MLPHPRLPFLFLFSTFYNIFVILLFPFFLLYTPYCVNTKVTSRLFHTSAFSISLAVFHSRKFSTCFSIEKFLKAISTCFFIYGGKIHKDGGSSRECKQTQNTSAFIAQETFAKRREGQQMKYKKRMMGEKYIYGERMEGRVSCVS